MTLNSTKFNSVISIHVIGNCTICFNSKPYEIRSSNYKITCHFSCHFEYFCKDMVDCLSKISHAVKRKTTGSIQHSNCFTDIKLITEHLCIKSENSIMQKSRKGFDLSPCKQNEMSPASVEQGCVEKAEKPQNVWQRRDSFSSCSSDSAVYCSTRHTQGSVPDEPVRMLLCENSDGVGESKRQRHSSGSSVISIASDASCKEPQPGSNKKSVLGCLAASSKLNDTDAVEVSENVVLVSHIKKTKSTVISISKQKQETIVKEILEVEAPKKMDQSSPSTVRHHDLRKNIRRKACCHGDCNETHTTFIVRRYTEVHSSTGHVHPPNTSLSKRSVPSSSTPISSVESSPNSSKKRKSEIDKLFADLHETKWGKNFSPDTILKQTEARRSTCVTKLFNHNDSSSETGVVSSPQGKGRTVQNSRYPAKNSTAKGKTCSSESSSARNRPSIHFLNPKSEQIQKANSVSQIKVTRRSGWLSKKAAEDDSVQKKSTETLVLNSVAFEPEVYVIEDDNTDVANTEIEGKKSPIFVQAANATKGKEPLKTEFLVNEIKDTDKTVPVLDGSPQSAANAQSSVICEKIDTLSQTPTSDFQDNISCSLVHSEQDVHNLESVNNSCASFPTSPDKDSPKTQFSISVEMLSEDPLPEDPFPEDQLCCESKCSSNAETHSCQNESSELPLLSSQDSPIKDAPISETPPVLEPCFALPEVHSDIPVPKVSPLASSTPNHVLQDCAAALCESDSDRSRTSSPEILFLTPEKRHGDLVKSTGIESIYMEQEHNQQQNASPSSCSVKTLSRASTPDQNSSSVVSHSSSKRASRLILKKYVKSSNKKSGKHKHKGSSWTDDDEKMWSCVVVEGDQNCDSDEENQLTELLNHRIPSPVTLAESVNNSGCENEKGNDTKRTSSSETNCVYQKHPINDNDFSAQSNKSHENLPSGSYIVHVKNVAQPPPKVKVLHNSSLCVTHKKHGKSVKSLHLKQKIVSKKLKKATTGGGSASERKKDEDRRDAPQEVIKLRMLYGFTLHYKGITVNKNDSYTQVILKLTTSKSIFLSVEALMELKDTLNSAGNDSNCQVLIINGIGNSFCSGLDLRPLVGPRKKDAAMEMAVAVKEFIEALASFHKPLVSVVNGSAVGLGVTLLTYSDVVLASDSASFHMPYVQLGYMPEGAVTLTLPHVMRSTVAMDMLLRGRKITAHQARDYGLVSEVLEAKKLPQQLVSRVRILAESPISAMESTKSMLRLHLYGKLHVALENEVEMLPKQWLSPACQVALKNAFQSGLLGE